MKLISTLLGCVFLLISLQSQAYLINPNKALNLGEFSEKVARKIYDYNFENVDYNLNSIKSYFTERGYRRFRKALSISKNADYVRKHKLQVSNVLLQEAKLEKRLSENEWVYRMKLKVKFSGVSIKKQNTLWVLMRLLKYKQDQPQLFDEIGVDQVVVYPTSLEPRRV